MNWLVRQFLHVHNDDASRRKCDYMQKSVVLVTIKYINGNARYNYSFYFLKSTLDKIGIYIYNALTFWNDSKESTRRCSRTFNLWWHLPLS